MCKAHVRTAVPPPLITIDETFAAIIRRMSILNIFQENLFLKLKRQKEVESVPTKSPAIFPLRFV